MRAIYNDVLTVFGLFLLNTVLSKQVAGNLNNWGQIYPYIASYFYYIDPQVRVSDLMMEAPISYIAEALMGVGCGYFVAFLNPYWIIVIVVFSNSIILFLSSFINNAYQFAWVYGIGIGAISGGIFFPGIWILWNHISSHKPLITGIILFAYSVGATPFGLLFTLLTNPDNESGIIIGDSHEKIFSQEVANRVPTTIRWSISIIFIVMLLGLLITPRKWDSSKSQQSESSLTFKEMIKSAKFWNLFTMMLIGQLAYFYILFLYKVLGMIYINDDHYISYVGSVGFIMAAFGRVFFGILLDKFSWKTVAGTTYALLVVFYTTFEFCLESKVMFAVYVITINFLSSEIFLSMLIISERIFPKDKWIFTFISLTFILDLAFIYASEVFLIPVIGCESIFYIIGVLLLIVFFQTLLLKDDAIIGRTDKLEDRLLSDE
jgi:hypothetical protein